MEKFLVFSETFDDYLWERRCMKKAKTMNVVGRMGRDCDLTSLTAS